jgi:hypothetical protein
MRESITPTQVSESQHKCIDDTPRFNQPGFDMSVESVWLHGRIVCQTRPAPTCIWSTPIARRLPSFEREAPATILARLRANMLAAAGQVGTRRHKSGQLPPPTEDHPARVRSVVPFRRSHCPALAYPCSPAQLPDYEYVPASVDKPVNIYLLRIRFWQGV